MIFIDEVPESSGADIVFFTTANMVQILKGKWVFKIKRDGIYKARWIIKGYE